MSGTTKHTAGKARKARPHTPSSASSAPGGTAGATDAEHTQQFARMERTDRTLRRRCEKLEGELEKLRMSQQEVIQHERLHALGQMASGIVHDFNNALTPILGASDFLLMNPDMLDNRKESLILLDSIRTAARDAKNVVHRLREFYRPDEDAEMGPVNVNDVAAHVFELTQPKWKGQAHANGFTIETRMELSEVPPVLGSKSQLREVLANILLNSLDAMPEGGRLTIRTSMEEAWVVIRVIDTGRGMTSEICQRCFEPFFSTKGKNGTGLGLSIAYGIVQKYKGRIFAESAPGKGTTLTIKLPAVEPVVKETPGAPEAEAAVPPQDILVADENALSREIVARHLVADGHHVTMAGDAMEAIAKCRETPVSVVLLCRVMAKMSGLQLASNLKKEFPGIRVLLFTGYNDPNEDVSAMEGVDAFLEKPATRKELRHALARTLQLP